MKKIKQAIAILIAVALLIDPCMAAGSIKDVKAADTSASVYDQMKVTDIELNAGDLDKDALEVGNEGVKLITDVTVDVPEGWAVSEIEVGWYCVKYDDYYEYATGKYDVSAQPENHVYSVEYNLHKYMKADIYYLADIGVEFVEVGNEKNSVYLYGEPEDLYKVASASDPVKMEWELETEDDYIEVGDTDYTGTANYTIIKAGGKDNTAPKVTALKMNTTGTLKKNMATEINVTTKESGSGIQYIAMISVTDDWENEEMLVFEADGMEKYTGTRTLTLKSDSLSLNYRGSGKYYVYAVMLQDYAGNTAEYYIDDKGTYLVSEQYVQNEDGSADEVIQKIKTVKYNVCNGHVYRDFVTKATTSANGSIVKKCKYCDAVKSGSKTTISRIKTVKLSKTSFVYDGTVKKPTVSVFDANGNKIAAKNYTVTYPTGRKNVGEYKVKIVFKNNYKGTVYKTFTIKPKGTSITSTAAGTKKFTVKWKKQATQTTGYQIRYSTTSDFKSYNSKIVSNKNTTSTTIKNLKAGKKYYVKVRTYKTVKVNGVNKKIYSAWSGVKTVKTK